MSQQETSLTPENEDPSICSHSRRRKLQDNGVEESLLPSPTTRKKIRLAILKAKLALAKRKQASLQQQQQQEQQQQHQLTPISALSSFDGKLTQLSKTGAAHLVFFPHPEFPLDLGQSELWEVEQGVLTDLPECIVEEEEEDSDSNDEDEAGNEQEPPMSLAERRRQLQHELFALKERLEQQQQQQQQQHENGQHDETSTQDDKEPASSLAASSTTALHLSKQELQRRKEQAKLQVDRNYWKHLVSKQEHMLVVVQEQVEETESSLQKVNADLQETQQAIETSKSRHSELQVRMSVLQDTMIARQTDKVLAARRKLAEIRKNKRAEEQPEVIVLEDSSEED